MPELFHFFSSFVFLFVKEEKEQVTKRKKEQSRNVFLRLSGVEGRTCSVSGSEEGKVTCVERRERTSLMELNDVSALTVRLHVTTLTVCVSVFYTPVRLKMSLSKETQWR